jgi:WD40 repeat protein/serine/threonine protein kinase
MNDLTGQQFGNYRLLRLLGRGSFAEVYLGEHIYLKTPAAVKLLHRSLTEEDAERFLTEARMLARLKHPYIVNVLDFDMEQTTPVLVMQYASRGTLRQRFPQGSRLSLTTAAMYVKQAAEALQYAHNRNVIHRDVKPENMLLVSDRSLLLSDFGIALLAPSPTLLSTQQMAGTLYYAAPEQLRGRPTFASDQYSLGVVTYEWLCGVRPFEGAKWVLVQKHMFATPPPLRAHSPDIPASVEEVVLKALAKDPSQRFANVQAFGQAFERACLDAGVLVGKDLDATQPLLVPPIYTRPPVSETVTQPEPSSPVLPKKRSVFLSASPADAPFAARLQNDLRLRDIQFSNDFASTLAPEVNQEDVLRTAMRSSDCVLVVISPHTRSSRTVREHLRMAGMYQRRLVFVWAAGEALIEMLLEASTYGVPLEVADARETRYTLALDEIVAYVDQGTPPRSPRVPSQPLSEPRNPYKGLHAFDSGDVKDFFGRTALVEEIVKSLHNTLNRGQAWLPAARLLAVVGPSGSGKSSVVRAGLLPQLQSGALSGSEHWIYLSPIVPEKRPIESLALALEPHLLHKSIKAIIEDLRDDSFRGLHLLATRMVKSPGDRVVLLIDQFEELFSSSVAEQERQQVIDLLLAAVTEPGGPVVILLTLRADFYDRPMRYPALSHLVQEQTISVLPMELHELRAVIEQPAALPDVKLVFEGNLVGDLLFETYGQAGALPLLEFTLDELFRQRTDHWITCDAYEQMGGVKGALAKHAENTYSSLPTEEHRRLARRLFLRLIDLGIAESDTTRRRAPLEELKLQDEQQTNMLQEVANVFVAARLLTTSETAGTSLIEVSHEALISQWPRLSRWLSEARDDIFLQQTISADAAEWQRRGQLVERLYRGSQLTEALAWSKRNEPSQTEADFLAAAVRESERQEKQKQDQERLKLEQQGRELRLKRQTVTRLYGLVAVLTLLVVASVIFATITQGFLRRESDAKAAAIAQAHAADSRALAANASDVLTQDRLDLALLLSTKAVQADNTYEARNSLLSALEHSPQIVTMLRSGQKLPISNLIFGSEDLIVASDGINVYIWNTKTREHPLYTLNQQPYIGGIALSSDHQTLAISNASGVWLWDVQTGKEVAMLDGSIKDLPTDYRPHTALAFSLDGQSLASARCSQFMLITEQNTYSCLATLVSVWNVQSKQLLSQYTVRGSPDMNTATFSPDGQFLAFSSETNVQIVNIATGQRLGLSFPCNTDQITSMAFNSDNTALACGSATSIQVLDVVPPHSLISSLKGHSASISGMVFSSDGQTLASSSLDKTVRLWDITSGRLIVNPLTGDGQQKFSVAFSSDDKTLITGNRDGTLLLWNITAESTISQQLAETGILRSLVFNADGTRVFAGSSDGKLLLYDVKTGKVIDTFDTASYPIVPNNSTRDDLHTIESLALSQDGTKLAAGRLDGTIIVWDTRTKQSFSFVDPHLLYRIALSSDGQTLAASEGGDIIALWNVTQRSLIRTFPFSTSDPLGRLPIDLRPDGKMLAVGGCEKQITKTGCKQGQVQLWDVATGKIIGQPFLGHTFAVSSLAFSPDGQTLASSSSQDGVILWDVATGKPRGHPLSLPTGNQDTFTHLLFSPKGRMVALYSNEGNPRFGFVLWNVERQELLSDVIHVDDAVYGSIAFSPDERQVVSVSLLKRSPQQGALAQWDIAPELWQEHACTIANRNLTKEEWIQFVRDEVTQSEVCSNLTP